MYTYNYIRLPYDFPMARNIQNDIMIHIRTKSIINRLKRMSEKKEKSPK